MDTLRVGIGSSTDADAAAAGRAAARQAVARLGGDAPALVIVYASMRYRLPALLAAVRAVTGDAPLVGASSSGQFHDGGALVDAGGPSVSVLAMTSGGYRIGVASATGLADDPFSVGHGIARAARAAAGPDLPRHSVLLLLSCGLRGDPQALLSGVYRVAGAAVPVAGGAASGGVPGTGTVVFHGDRVLTDAAVGVWLASELPPRVACANGWRAEGLPMLVTGVDGFEVCEIAGRPAVEVFRECFQGTPPPGWNCAGERNSDHPPQATCGGHDTHGGHGGHDTRPRQYAAHALGLVEPDGTQVIRGVTIDEHDTMRAWAPLPLYSAVRAVSCLADELLDAAEEAVDAATAPDDEAVPSGRPGARAGSGGQRGHARLLLLFSCAGRLEILGDRGGEEAKRVQAAAGDVPAFGFFTFGEFARTTSVAGYHNAAMAVLAL